MLTICLIANDSTLLPFQVRVIRGLLRGNVKQNEISVLTPYRLQMSKIKDKLKDEDLKDVGVNSITNSQGKRKPFVFQFDYSQSCFTRT